MAKYHFPKTKLTIEASNSAEATKLHNADIIIGEDEGSLIAATNAEATNAEAANAEAANAEGTRAANAEGTRATPVVRVKAATTGQGE